MVWRRGRLCSTTRRRPVNRCAAALRGARSFKRRCARSVPYPQPYGVVPPDGLQGISYDSASNRINVSGFAYDAAGNQVRALIPGSSTVSQRFQYDAANCLVKVNRMSTRPCWQLTPMVVRMKGCSPKKERCALTSLLKAEQRSPNIAKSYVYLGSGRSFPRSPSVNVKSSTLVDPRSINRSSSP